MSMKSQITSVHKIHNEFPSGLPCHLTRITLEPVPTKTGREYTTLTYESQKEEYQMAIVDGDGEYILDENKEIQYETKYETIVGNLIHKSTEPFTIAAINQISALVAPSIPVGLDSWESDIYKIGVALKYRTVNDPVLEGPFMGDSNWDLDFYSK